MQFVKNLNKKNLTGRRVLLRASLNVPLNKNGEIVDDFRVKKALETIEFLHEKGAKIIVIAHLGRDKNKSLKVVSEKLNEYIKVKFADLDIRNTFEIIKLTEDNDIILLENLRKYDGETKNDMVFAGEMALLGDIFVQDAFSVCHRKHASITGIPKFLPSFAGLLVQKEVAHLSKLHSPVGSSLFVLGGSKLNTKLHLIKKIIKNYSQIFIGGAILNTFLQQLGFEIGGSLVSKDSIPKHILQKDNIILPKQVVVSSENGSRIVNIDEVLPNEKIVDVITPKHLLNNIDTVV